MSVHLVRVKGSALEHKFFIQGKVNSRVEEMLMRTIDQFYSITGELVQRLGIPKVYSIHLDAKGGNNYSRGDRLNLNTTNLTEWTVTHELAHALDAAYKWKLSQQMRVHTGSGFSFKALHYARPGWKLFWYRVGSPPPPCGIDKNFNSLEDFAETVTAYIYPDEAKRRAEMRGYPYEKWGYTHFHDTPRGLYFKKLVDMDEKITPS
jgi:hypothetical protein